MNKEKNQNKIKTLALLTLIVLIGSGLRFYHLGEESLWTDEIISLIHARQIDLQSLWQSVKVTELTPPGYFIILHYWARIFGESELSMRFLSAAFDIGSIILVFILGSKLFDRKTGAIAALFHATVMLQIVYAQEARNFSIFGFFALLSTLLFLELCHKRKPVYIVAYVLVNAFSIYLNYMAFFLIAFHLIIFIISPPADKRGGWYFLSLALICLLGLPVYNTMISQFLWRNSVLKEVLVLWGIPEIIAKSGALFFILPVMTLIICFLIGYLFLKKRYFNPSYSFIIAATLTALSAIMVVHIIFLDKTMRSFAMIRHTFFVAPLGYMLAGKVINVIISKSFKYFIIFAVLIFNVATLSVYYSETTKAPWEGAAIFIRDNAPASTLILFDRSGSNLILFDYYYNEDFRHINLTWTESEKLIKINEQELSHTLDDENLFWLISSRNVETKGYYKGLLDRNYRLLLEKHYTEISLYLYEVGQGIDVNPAGQENFK